MHTVLVTPTLHQSSKQHTPIMDDETALPEAVLAAIDSGDVTQLQPLYNLNPTISLEKIAQTAAEHVEPEILEWCFTQGWAPPPESFNGDLFFAAISGASPAIFQILLDHGWNFDAHDSESCGDTLASAIMNEDYEFTKWLLEHGHRVTPHDPIYGPSALSTTVCGPTASIKMLTLLLDHGIELKNSGAGIAAADAGNLEGLKLLLDRGVELEDREMWWYPFGEDADEPARSQGTALYRACRQGRVECVKLLLDRGADAEAKDDGGTSCIDIAGRRGYIGVVKLLKERGTGQ
jgi:hypothetical protein